MFQKQKETILALLEQDEIEQNENRYWFLYRDFLEPTDEFTAFSCENLEGKQGYINMIDNLLKVDENAKIFVEVYGFDEFLYADTLIIYSTLSFDEIKQIFYEPKDIFPSDIGELTDFSQQYFIIDNNGDLLPVESLSVDQYSVYYCWWD